MEIKLQCNCGQKYKFDVEPVNGRMPFAVNCPICGVDGTHSADAFLAQTFPQSAPAVVATAAPVAEAIGGGLRVNRAVQTAPPVTAPPPPLAAPPSTIGPARGSGKAPSNAQVQRKPNFALGILGALLGAGVGIGLMYGFFALTNFRFPLLGVGIGALTGYGARLMSRQTNPAMGTVAATVAFFSVAGTLYLMFGEVQILNIISMLVSVSVAYRLASA